MRPSHDPEDATNFHLHLKVYFERFWRLLGEPPATIKNKIKATAYSLNKFSYHFGQSYMRTIGNQLMNHQPVTLSRDIIFLKNPLSIKFVPAVVHFSSCYCFILRRKYL